MLGVKVRSILLNEKAFVNKENSELNIKHYRENLAVRHESICLVLHALGRIPNFIGQLTEH